MALVRAAVAMPQWRLRNADGYTVTGVPVLAEDLADALAGATLRLLLIAVVVMALVLAAVFRRPARLVPLGVALAATAVCGGLMALAGAPLTLASVAVLPVLLGLAVDYAVQYQARVDEEGSARRAARRAGPAIGGRRAGDGGGLPRPAALARADGAGVRRRARRRRRRRLRARPHGRHRRARAGRARHDWDTGARTRRSRPRGRRSGVAGRGESCSPSPRRGAAAHRGARRASRPSSRRPGRVLAVAAALAAAGWALDTQARVESDLRALVPQDLPAVRDLATLEATTGVAGQIDVLVEGRDLTEPAAVAWMRALPGARGARGRRPGRRRLRAGRAVPGPRAARPGARRRAGRTADGIRALLAAVPPSFSRALITRDRRTATLAFGIKNVPLAEQQAVVARMRALLDPPPGVRAELAGAARAGRGGQRGPHLAVAAARHAAGRPARRRARAARRPPPRRAAPGCRSSRSRWPRAGRRSSWRCWACR